MTTLDDKLFSILTAGHMVGNSEQFATTLRQIIREEISTARATSRKKLSSIPDSCPSDADKAHAVAYWQKLRRPDLVARVEDEAEQFHDHHTAHDTKLVDWSAGWRYWCRNSLKINKPPRGTDLFAAPAPVLFEQTDLAGWVGRLEVFYGLDEHRRAGSWSGEWGPPPGQKNCRMPPEAKMQFDNRKSILR